MLKLENGIRESGIQPHCLLPKYDNILGLMKSEPISPEREVVGSNPIGRTRE